MKDVLIYVIALVLAALGLICWALLRPNGPEFWKVYQDGTWERVELPPVHRVMIPQTIRKTA